MLLDPVVERLLVAARVDPQAGQQLADLGVLGVLLEPLGEVLGGPVGDRLVLRRLDARRELLEEGDTEVVVSDVEVLISDMDSPGRSIDPNKREGKLLSRSPQAHGEIKKLGVSATRG